MYLSAMPNNMTPLEDCTFVAFDTETTGIGAGSKLVEIAGSRFRGDEVLGTFEALIDPEVPIPPESTSINQITDEMVKGKQNAKTVLKDFFDFAEDATLIAHNAPFDAGMIGLELTRHHMPPAQNPILDTLRASRRLFPAGSHTLDAMMDLLGLPAPDARHRALGDSELVRHLVGRITESLKDDAKTMDGIMQYAGPADLLENHILRPPPLTRELELLESACREGKKINLQIDGGGTQPKQQIVVPQIYYTWKGTEHLEAFCPEAGHTRLFRLDRVIKVEPGASSGFLF